MVKSVKEKVDEIVNGKKQNLRLSIHGASVEYEDILGWSMNGDWVAVMLKDGSTEVHPAKDVSFARHFSVEA